MRGTDDADLGFAVETCRAAFELRHGDARIRTRRALQSADPATARALTHLLQDHRHRRLNGDAGPTPETLVHRRRGNHTDTIGRMLSFAEQAAALQIATVVEALTAPLRTAACRWEQGRVDGSGGGDGMSGCLAQLYQQRYLPWARWMADPTNLFHACKACGRRYAGLRIERCAHCGSMRIRRLQPHLPLVLSIAVFGAGLEQCARAYHMGPPRALELLRAGLGRYLEAV
jgi:hypothetical protein